MLTFLPRPSGVEDTAWTATIVTFVLGEKSVRNKIKIAELILMQWNKIIIKII